ncbi:MAG: DegT/DnrJ/EryC1/StrS aminotransferase family protein, partial [Rhizobiales bacterium]|nr:DegT/DnrJ/EryC1/StrS aminotransferase family protein [Hyphomicrobiales bacterium]
GTAHVAAILVEPLRRDGLRAFLTEKRVQTSLHYPPLHTLGAFSDCRAGDLSHSSAFCDAVVVLPIHPELPVMAPEHIIRLCVMCLAGKQPGQPHAADGCLQVA